MLDVYVAGVVPAVWRRSWKAKPRQAGCSGGWLPHPPVAVAAAQQPTLGGGEHQPGSDRLAVGGQLLGQGGNERAALMALDAADTAMGSADEEDSARRPRAAFFNPARLIDERGVALARRRPVSRVSAPTHAAPRVAPRRLGPIQIE